MSGDAELEDESLSEGSGDDAVDEEAHAAMIQAVQGGTRSVIPTLLGTVPCIFPPNARGSAPPNLFYVTASCGPCSHKLLEQYASPCVVLS